jgi:hypothetical protein
MGGLRLRQVRRLVAVRNVGIPGKGRGSLSSTVNDRNGVFRRLSTASEYLS